MKKLLIWLGIGLVSLVALLIFVILGLNIRVNSRLNQIYAIQPELVPIPDDEASIAEGKRLVEIYCASCHGENLAGADFFEDPALAVIGAPNLTAGNGGIAALYTDADWVRTIRHGVDPQGRPLVIMPAKDFYYFSNEDLGQMIAYLKNAPAADSLPSDIKMTPLGRALVGVGAFGDMIPAESIDHAGPRPSAPSPSISGDYGDYLVQTFGCRTCHGAQLSGGKDPNPDAPPGPNLTPGGNLKGWSQQDFINLVRTRTSEWMPYESLSKMNDAELSAIFLYLQDLPALETTVK